MTAHDAGSTATRVAVRCRPVVCRVMFDVPLATHAAAPIRTKQQIHAASTTSGNEVVVP